MKFETNLSRCVQQLENGSNKDSHFVATKKTTYKQHCNVPCKVKVYALGGCGLCARTHLHRSEFLGEAAPL